MLSLAEYFEQNRFCVLVEYLSSAQKIVAVPTQLAGFPTCMTLADRVSSDDDPSPLLAAKQYPEHIDKVLHCAGKGKDIKEFEQFLVQAQQAGHTSLLCLTGDKLKQHQSGTGLLPRSRYLESVNAVMAAKSAGGFCVGVALNPYKYTSTEKAAQYFKLHKKIKVGADFIVTQLGFDLSALKAALQFLQTHQYPQKLMACVMPLTLARARFMVKNHIAGIVITQAMLQMLEQEQEQGKQEQVYQRCALQILICQHLGLAGVHLTTCQQPSEQALLEKHIKQYQDLDLVACEQLWYQLWACESDALFQPDVKPLLPTVSVGMRAKYQMFDVLHDSLFNSTLALGVGNFIFKAYFWNRIVARKLLVSTEHLTKNTLVGCESCGQCRLKETLYICPETCPKGLANGACGGTVLDVCEFGNQECIHSIKARLAMTVNQTQILEDDIIAAVPIERRGSSSWRNWYIQDAKSLIAK